MNSFTSCRHCRALTLQCVGEILLSSTCLFNLFITRTNLLIVSENFQYACSAFSAPCTSKYSMNRFRNEFLHNSNSFFEVTVVSKSFNSVFNSGSSFNGFCVSDKPPVEILEIELFMFVGISEAKLFMIFITLFQIPGTGMSARSSLQGVVSLWACGQVNSNNMTLLIKLLSIYK